MSEAEDGDRQLAACDDTLLSFNAVTVQKHSEVDVDQFRKGVKTDRDKLIRNRILCSLDLMLISE